MSSEIKWQMTNKIGDTGFKVGIYGKDGSGKTSLIPTAPRPLIVNVENKLLSISHHSLPSAKVDNWKDYENIHRWLMSDSHERKNFDTCFIDSTSALAQMLLAQFKSENKDPRRAYQFHRDEIDVKIRDLVSLPDKNIVFVCKASLIDQPDGTKIYGPSMPGCTADMAIGYYLNELFFLNIGSYATGQLDANQQPIFKQYRFLQTRQTIYEQARDNSQTLKDQEKPDLSHIFNTIRAGVRLQ